jgi:glycolate oxidase iron-sulfur subunit
MLPEPESGEVVLGTHLPEGARFFGPEPGATPNWPLSGDMPTEADLSTCVACGLCLPHCPTYRLTGEESASPRGRITAMRMVSEGRERVDHTFASFMDLCLVCRACEDVCPSHVPFGRMMERARVQIEPLRSRRARFLRWLGLDLTLSSKKLLWLASASQRLAKPFLPKRLRTLLPRHVTLFGRLAAVTEPEGEERGTVAILSGCVQDRWYRETNRATIRVLVHNGWRVLVPRAQACCGALQAHFGRLDTARRLAHRNLQAFADADVVVVNTAGCSAHMKDYDDLLGEEASPLATKTRDLMEFLFEQGIRPPKEGAGVGRVAYHDACHASRAQGIWDQPRALLRAIPSLELVEIANGDRCCGAAGLYNVLQPEMAGALRREKAEAVAATGASVVCSANPGCSLQIAAGLRAIGANVEVLHPVELLDRAYRQGT